jgi:hypothetical protein
MRVNIHARGLLSPPTKEGHISARTQKLALCGKFELNSNFFSVNLGPPTKKKKYEILIPATALYL